jgi:hypothetical protein
MRKKYPNNLLKKKEKKSLLGDAELLKSAFSVDQLKARFPPTRGVISLRWENFL